MKCPLCQSEKPVPFHHDRRREYLLCLECDLVSVPARYFLPPEREKVRYHFHRNDLSDPNYHAYLSRLFDPLKDKLSPGAHGLDFGCGPSPGLSMLFEEAGFPCRNYDPFFANDPSVFETLYDFLACSETAEHFYRPREEFERLVRLVRHGGWIGIMTQLRDEAKQPFESWFYKNDLTHVCFFSRRTFHWMEKNFGLRAEFHSRGVVLLTS